MIKEDNNMKKHNSFNNILNKKTFKENSDMNIASIIKRIKIMQSNLKYSYNQLLDENNDKNIKHKILITSSEEKNSNKKEGTEKISPFVKVILKKVNNKISEVNQSALEIAKLNYLYYLNKPSNSIIVQSSKDKSLNIKNRAKSSNNIEMNNDNDKNSKNESDLMKKIRNRSLLKNFVYINNNYHQQLNNAFMKFNPTAHLNNMKILLEACPSFHEDILREKNEIENDIDFKNDKFKFKKKYLNYLNRQNLLSVNKPKILIKAKIKKDNINKSVSLPKIKIKEQNEDINKIPLINKLKKNKGEDFTRFKNYKINELNKLIDISSEVNNLIERKTLDEKIKKFINDYNMVKFEAESKHNNFDINLNKIDYFKSEKSKIDDKMKSFYLKKYFNSIDNKEKNLFSKLNSELDIFANKNNNNRDISLNELDNFLLKNNIDIDIAESKKIK